MPQTAPTDATARPPGHATADPVRIDDPRASRHTGREWLLTNALGGYAMGTVRGGPARRYHATLIGATTPPVGRVTAVSGVQDRFFVAENASATDLTAYDFHTDPGRVRDPAPETLRSFELRCGVSARWVFEAAGVEITRTLALHHARNGASVEYTARRLTPDARPGRLEVRPLTPLRGFHDLPQHPPSPSELGVTPSGDGVVISRGDHTLRIRTASDLGRPDWVPDAAVWVGLFLAAEADRGQDAIDHPLSAGLFRWDLSGLGPNDPAACRFEFAIEGPDGAGSPGPVVAGAPDEARLGTLAEVTIRSAAIEPSPESASVLARLVIAGDQFVVRRGDADGLSAGVSIIAGYPWFSDWGRDTMICLPGLLLATGRHDDARDTLLAFARHQRRGLIPNRFEDRTGEAEYNTVDAALWFVHACTEYLRVSRDTAGFRDALLEPCREVLRWYRDGTDHGIRMDPADALITQGDENTQLTWMDALREGIAFTPRAGKPVEINALWHHALVRLAMIERADDPAEADRTLALATRAAGSFVAGFVRDDGQGCADRLEPDGHGNWHAVHEIRPNQLFAASLEHSPLSSTHRRAVVGVCREHLLTPRGMRTLAPTDPAYRGRFEGDLMSRDAAYHQGTVWPWLIGAYVEGVLRAGSWSPEARAHGREVLAPLIAMLDGPSLNQIYEVYDGDHTPERPSQPGGCPAQAWSVAETLRAFVLAHRDRAPERA